MSISVLILGFVINLVAALILVRFVYYPAQQDKNMVFTYLAFNTVIYFVMAFLSSVELGIGVGFGLFAVFSVLRYRTVEMSSREMTYLFIVIALPVMNAVGAQTQHWLLLCSVSAAVIALLWVLEKGWGFHYESSQNIKYDRLDLLHPERRALLIGDLEERLGIRARRVDVLRIDMLEETAQLRIYFEENADVIEPRPERVALKPIEVGAN